VQQLPALLDAADPLPADAGSLPSWTRWRVWFVRKYRFPLHTCFQADTSQLHSDSSVGMLVLSHLITPLVQTTLEDG
jgi:hypothetical protein